MWRKRIIEVHGVCFVFGAFRIINLAAERKFVFFFLIVFCTVNDSRTFNGTSGDIDARVTRVLIFIFSLEKFISLRKIRTLNRLFKKRREIDVFVNF